MKERQVLMRRISYSFFFLASSLCLALLAASSFGSNRFTQEETQEKSIAPATAPQRAVPSESTLPHDVRVHILSFLSQQKDLRIGAASISWRKAAGKVWKKRWLDLSNKYLTKADFHALAGGIFPRLRLNEINLAEKAIEILAPCSHLQALELRRNNLRATKSLTKLFSLSHLPHIDLYDNRIGNEGAKAIAEALAQNKTLTTVDLGYNDIDDEGAKAIAGALAQNTALTSINLSVNWIGDEEAKAMPQAIRENKTLTLVNLSVNWIGDEGAEAIAGALSQNTTLTTVNLWSNRIGDKGKKTLEDLKRSRPSLTLEY